MANKLFRLKRVQSQLHSLVLSPSVNQSSSLRTRSTLMSLALGTLALFCVSTGSAFAQNWSLDTPPPTSELNLAAADWCPYSCADPEAPGIVAEALRATLGDFGIDLQVKVFPWSRALKMAEMGQVDGLLTAVPSEAPGFIFTDSPSGQYQICVYSRRNSNLRFDGRNSLRGLTLGAIQDYGYGEPLDSIIAAPKADEGVYIASNSAPLRSLIEMTKKFRIDAFVEDKLVLARELGSKDERQLRSAGCLESVPFFTAISPKHESGKAIAVFLSKLYASDTYIRNYQSSQEHYAYQVVE